MNLTGKHYGIILATLVTALLHLFLLTRLGLDPIALNGFGYLALLGAYFLPIPFPGLYGIDFYFMDHSGR